jgi:hypothetical protein
LTVLASVNLDDQFGAQTGEIDNIRPERHLATKVRAVSGQLTQLFPQAGFGKRCVAPQSPRGRQSKALKLI